MANTYEEGVVKLFNLTLRAIDLLETRLKIIEDEIKETGKILSEETTNEVRRIVKVLPKLHFVFTQAWEMKKRVDRAKEDEENYSKADLIMAQKYITKLLAEYEENSEVNSECS